MGISQEVYTIYGWEVECTEDINKWLEQIDYDLPEGFILYGMDSTKIMVGPVLFYSGDARWDVLEGFESFTESHAEKIMSAWQDHNSEHYTKMQGMAKGLNFNPMFFTFVNYS